MRIVRLVFVALMAVASFGDVKVTHPDKAPDDKTRVPSPMVLELPLPTSDPARWNKGEQRPKDLQDLKNFVCDTVMFRDVAISAKKLRGDEIENFVKFQLYTEPGVDKLVTVRVEILSDGQVVGLGIVRNIDAEEGKLSDGNVRITLPQRYIVPEKSPVLRFTMTVQANP